MKRLVNGATGGLFAGLVVGVMVFAAFRLLPFLTAQDVRARDLVHAEFHQPIPTRDDIALVLIEENTLAMFPYRSPIDRGFLAELIINLKSLGPTAIAFDILIDQPTEDEKDVALINAIAAGDGPPVFVAAAAEADGLTTQQADILAAATAEARIAQAVLLSDPYADVVRAAPETSAVRGRAAPGFAAALAREAGVDVGDEGFEIDFAPVVGGAEFAPRYVAGFHQYLTKDQIGGRLVLIGTSLPGTDRHATPLTVLAEEGETPGVEVHAQALAQLLDGRELREVGLGAELAFIVAVAALAGLALAISLNVPARAGLCALVLLAAAAAPALALTEASLRAPALSPLVAGALAAAAVALERWRRDRRTRRRLRDAFGKFVSPAVVKEIEGDPAALRLGGAKREVTCVFTDVAGFTTLCEGLAAEELVDLLNRYLGGASEVFVDHGGTIDKFVGDAVVGFFGAPVPRDDHAEAAIRMAVALDRFAGDFVAAEARRGRAFGVTRIGVHSGEATVGNFGGDLFFDYTAMGDTVNVAARLEGANKAFAGTLCISDEALTRAGGAIEGVLTRPIGALRVKGRDAPLLTHEAFACDDPRSASRDAYLNAYMMLENAPDRAAAAFAALAEAAPGDGLVAFHAERLAAGDAGAVVTLKEK